MESLITLNCSNYSENVADILKLFQQIGWGVYNLQGKLEYLPIGDIDEYAWQCGELSEIEFYDMISAKAAGKEQIGVNLFYNNGVEGISFMAYTTEEIMLSISINRRTVKERYTDMIWYFENNVYKLWDIGVRLLSYKLEEYED